LDAKAEWSLTRCYIIALIRQAESWLVNFVIRTRNLNFEKLKRGLERNKLSKLFYLIDFFRLWLLKYKKLVLRIKSQIKLLMSKLLSYKSKKDRLISKTS